MVNLQYLRDKLSQEQGKRKLLAVQAGKAMSDKEFKERNLENILKARSIVQIVAENTQKKIEFVVSNLVTTALASVFSDPYKFELRFIQRRGKTEADLIFSKRGKETDDILNAGGGGVADVASTALRISFWSIKKNNHVMFLDEPGKFLHNPDYQQKFSDLLKEVSDKLGLQIIAISDQKEFLQSADKVITVENNKGVACIKEN